MNCKACPKNSKCPIQEFHDKREQAIKEVAGVIKATIAESIVRRGKKALYGTDYCSKMINSDPGCNGCEGKEGCRELVKAALKYYETGEGWKRGN
jgi:hypothetical protein